MTGITAIAKKINDQAADYQIGQLQSLRMQMKGMKRTSSVIFNPSRKSVNEAEGWAFHTGGREELQFNIGIESHADRFRFGVAFSLEPSRSLPSIATLLPKIDRFNEFVRNNSSDMDSFRMWVWRGDKIIKPDTAVRQIAEDEMEMPNFVFLGRSVSVESVDIPEVLTTFDQLLPLYAFVESGALHNDLEAFSGAHSPFEFKVGVTTSDSDTSVRKPQDEISVVLRSKKIKRRLQEELGKNIQLKLGDEIRSGNGGRIDFVVSFPSGVFDFYEIKPAVLARHAIREALPQLLEYAYRKGGKEARRLLIASQAPLDRDSDDFLSALRSKGLPVYYKHVPID